MPDAGVINSSIRIDIFKLQSDWMKVNTAFKLGSAQASKAVETLSLDVDSLLKRQGKTLLKLSSMFPKLRAQYIALAKSAKDPEERKAYEDKIAVIEALMLKVEKYADRSKKIAETKKRKEKEEAALAKETADAVVLAEQQKQAAMKNSIGVKVLTIVKSLLYYKVIMTAMRAIGRAVREAATATVDYEQQLANTQSVAQGTSKDLRALDAAARRAGETTRFTARESAEALYFMASAGYSATESIQALDGTLAMAQATGQSLQSTSEVLAVTIAQFGLEASESMRVANAMTAGITSSQATMDKYKTSLYQVGPVAAGTGRSLEEVLGILNVMYDSGMQASRAGRAMRNAMAELSNESSATVKKLTAMGIAFEDIDVTQNSLVDVFGTLNDAGLSTGQIMKAFGKVIGPQMQVIIRSSREELERYTKEVTNTNKAVLAAHIQNDTLQGDQYRLKSAWEALAISIGNNLIPAFRSVIQSMFEGIRAVNIWVKRLSGVHSIADDFSRTMNTLKERQDEYSRLTSLLNDKTIALTASERKLYEQRLRQAALDISASLRELSNDYEDVIQKQANLERANALAESFQKQQEEYEKLVTLYQSYDFSTMEAKRASAIKKALFSSYQNLTSSQQKIRAEYNIMLGLVDESTRETLTKLFKGVARIPVEVDKSNAKIGAVLAQPFGDADAFIQAMSDPNYYKGITATMGYAVQSFANATEVAFIDTGLAVAAASNDIDNALKAFAQTTEETVFQVAKLYAAEQITEKHMMSLNPVLRERIKNQAELLKLEKKTADDTVEYEAIEAMREQLDLSSKVNEATVELNKTMLDNAIDMLTSSSNIETASAGFDELRASVIAETEALRAQAQAQYDANEAVVEEAENVGPATLAALRLINTRQLENEMLKASLFETQKLMKVERERLAALGLLESAELDRLTTLENSYKTSQSVFQKYYEELANAELKEREEAVKTAYDKAQSLDAIGKAYQMELNLLVAKNAAKMDELKTSAEKEATAQQEALAEWEREAKVAYDQDVLNLKEANIAKKNDSITREAQRISEAESLRTEELASLAIDYAKNAITLKKYEADKIQTNKDADAEISLAHEEGTIEREAIDADSKTQLVKAEEEHTARVIAEHAKLNNLLIYLGITLNDAQKAQFAEYLKWIEEAGVKQKTAAEKLADAIFEDTKKLVTTITGMVGDIDAIMDSALERQLDRMDRALKALTDYYDEQEILAKETAGVEEDTEREKLEKNLMEAQKSADGEAIIEAEKELKRFDIKQDFDAKRKKADEDAAWAKAQLEYKYAMISWGLNAARVASEAALAIITAIRAAASAPLLKGWMIGATAVAAGTQVAAHVASKPSAPVKADYFGTGGMIHGTSEGTMVVAGERNRTEAIFNPEQMANLLLAIGNGKMSGTSEPMQVTFIMQAPDGRETARETVGLINKGQFLIDPKKGVRKVS